MAKGKKENAGEEPLKFEEALQKLEKLVEEMESGRLPLEEILKKYEEGNVLVRYCSQKLAEAEKRIEILVKTKEGALVAQPFEADAPAEPGSSEDADKEELF